jgi:hypothetical protein
MLWGTAIALVIAAISLTTFVEAKAHHRGRRVVVRHHPHRVVHHHYGYYRGPTIVRYVPAYHTQCVVRHSYYYHTDFGYHRHHHHPGGIHFGIHLVF